MITRRRLERRGREVRLRLPAGERDVLAQLAAELAARLEGEVGGDDLRRLFPPAYADDEREEAEYRRLMRGELLDGRRARLRAFVASLGGDRLDEEQLEAWLGVLNDLRLVLGTRLDVEEDTMLDLDPRDPRAPALGVYAYLSWLQEQAVEAAAARPGLAP